MIGNCGVGDDIEHADERLHAVELAADIFAQHAALQIGQNWFGFQVRSLPFAPRQSATTERHEQDEAEQDAIDRERRETTRAAPSA